MYLRDVIISEVRVLTFEYTKILNIFDALTWIPEFCQYPKISKILNTFCALTWIPEFCQYPKILKIFSTFGDLIGTRSHPHIWLLMSMHQMYSKFSGTGKIRVFTSMHQMYSKFSGTDKIRIFTSMHQMYSKFSGTDKIRVFTPMHQMYSKFSGTEKIWVSAVTLLGLVISRYPSDGYYDISAAHH